MERGRRRTNGGGCGFFFFFPHHCELSHTTEELNGGGGSFSSKAHGRHDAAWETQGRKEGREEGLTLVPTGRGAGKVQGCMEREQNDLYKRQTVRGSIRWKTKPKQECPGQRQTDRQSGGRTRSQTARASA